MKVSVIGAGGWGTALAAVIADNGHEVNLWVREPELFQAITEERENKQFLAGVKLPDKVIPSNDLDNVTKDADIIILATPSKYIREMANNLKSHIKTDAIIVTVAKGIEPETFKPMSEIIKEIIIHAKVIALSGPTHAEEVGRKKLTSAVLASDDESSLDIVKQFLSTDYFRLQTSNDIKGVELGGAVKNIIAIALGICDGLDLGDNAKASIVSKGFSELIIIGQKMGGKKETFMGLSGIGDLIVTSTSKHSRNRLFGELTAKGKSPDEINSAFKGKVVEGLLTATSVYKFCEKNNLNMPLINAIYNIIHNNETPGMIREFV